VFIEQHQQKRQQQQQQQQQQQEYHVAAMVRSKFLPEDDAVIINSCRMAANSLSPHGWQQIPFLLTDGSKFRFSSPMATN
jgi:hypothetical protein